MKDTHRLNRGRRELLRGAAALAGGYTLTRILSPGTAFADYREREVKSAAKITGQLTFDGQAPKPVMRPVTSNFDVAGKGPRVWEGLNLGKGRGLEDSIVVVNCVFEGKPHAVKPALSYAQGAVILPRIQAFGWNPEAQLVMENRIPILHSWVVYFNKEIKKNQAHPAKAPPVSFGLRDPGLYELNCAPHPWERAFRMAVAHPYFAMTDEDGRFEIAGLPAGDYTVDLWGEGLTPKRLWVPVHEDTVTLDRTFGAADSDQDPARHVMKTKRIHVLFAVAALVVAAGCSSSKSGAPAGGSSAHGAAAGPAKGEASPGSAALASPEDNYVAAATKIACLGLLVDSADAYAKGRAKILAAHAYTEDSWVAASKQLGKSKGDAIVSAMKCAL